MLYLRELLHTDPFIGAEFIAGENGINNIINTVTIAEVPDAANWLTGNELVCTSCYFLQEKTQEEIVEWFTQIIDSATGLIIKLHRYIEALPNSVIEYANQKSFPIIQVKPQISWPSIIEIVIEWTSSYKKADYLKDIREKYTDVILQSTEIGEIVDIIYEDFLNPIIIYDEKFNEVAQSSETFNSYGNLYTQLINTSLKREILLSTYYQKIKEGPSVDIGKFYFEDIDKHLYIIPIIATKTLHGFLIVLGIEKELESVDYDVMEYLSNLLSIKFMNRTLQKEDFLENPSTVPMLINKIAWGKSLSERHLVVLFTSSNNFERVNKQHFVKTIERTMKKMNIICRFAYENDVFTLFLTIEDAEDFSLQALTDVLQKIMNEFEQEMDRESLRFIVGNFVQNEVSLKRSYNDAKEILLESSDNSSGIVLYEDIGIYRLFKKLEDPVFINNYIDDYLTPILELEESLRNILLETLFQYMKSSGSVSIAAKAMYVHPNTILYRMKRIKELIGDPLRSMDYRQSLLLALEMYYLNLSNEARKSSMEEKV